MKIYSVLRILPQSGTNYFLKEENMKAKKGQLHLGVPVTNPKAGDWVQVKRDGTWGKILKIGVPRDNPYYPRLHKHELYTWDYLNEDGTIGKNIGDNFYNDDAETQPFEMILKIEFQPWSMGWRWIGECIVWEGEKKYQGW